MPDYSGNNHYNTIGNLVLDSRMGITIPLYENGGMIQLSGRASIDWDDQAAAAAFPGAQRIIKFVVDEIVELPGGTLPIRWTTDEIGQLQVQVVEKIYESDDVASFHLYPMDGGDIPSFQPGQYLPVSLPVGPDASIVRTYSLSGSNINKHFYKISVKRDPFGVGSTFLHDHVQIGDILNVQAPTGDFVYRPEAAGNNSTIVLLSTGIGATPVLSMLHSFIETLSASTTTAKALWVHGARDGKHHPFRKEVAGLVEQAGDRLQSHIVYSRPHKSDTGYDSVGRIDIATVKELVPDLKTADFYICGTGAFMADIETQLVRCGVAPRHIHQESF